MARPKSYDRNEALVRACNAFWEHGYEALGVRAIEEKTGLNQFAIRTEFGGKEGLFLEVLKLYADQAEKVALAPMKIGGIDALNQFFENLINPTSPTSSMWGCLIVNTGVENAKTGNRKFAAATRYYWQSMNAHFVFALQASKDIGELASDLDVVEASNTLVIAVMGVHTQNRLSGSPSAGKPMVKMVQEWLRGWRC